MDSVTDHALTSEGPGNQPGGIARQALATEQSSEGPGTPGGIAGSVRSGGGVKRKRNLHTYEARYQAITEVEKGAKKEDVAAKFGIPANTLSTWLKSKDEIKKKFLESDVGPQRKRDKKAKFPELETALVQWFGKARSMNIPISGEIVKEKARQFAEQLNIADFDCSTGWLDRFKDRHELSFKRVCGEANSVKTNSAAMSDWTSKLQTVLNEYEPSDIYNADETGLFYRMMPDKTLEYKNVKCHGGKMSKERLTVMVCANMTGTDKVPLFVIGKSRNPRCFKNLTTLPVQYEANKTAWVTSEIFTTWVKKLDRKVTAQGRQIVLIVDNCPAHPEISRLKSTRLLFLPPNTTSVTQPMDQGVICSLKKRYRSLVIQKKLRAMESACEAQVSVLDALHMLKSAWRQVTPPTIAHCFRHAGFEHATILTAPPPTDTDDPEDDIPLAALKRLTKGTSFAEYSSADDHVPVCPELTDAEIISNVVAQRDDQPSEEHEEEDDDDQPRPKRTIIEAMNGLEMAMDFLHQQNIGPDADRAISLIGDASAIFTRFYLRRADTRQTSIADFFV